MGLWAVPPIIRRLAQIPALPTTSSEDFVWPTLDHIHDAQEKYGRTRPPNLRRVDGLWTTVGGAFWIQDDSDVIKLRLCVIVHSSAAGHRGAAVTENALRSKFYWSTLSSDVRAFVRACIHCVSTTGGERIPHPYGPSVHEQKQMS